MTADSSIVCHDACTPSEVELRAREIIAHLLNDDDLSRVCERESKEQKPDFRSQRHAVEVKALASPTLRSYLAAERRHIHATRQYPIGSLRETWGVSADVSLAISSFDRDTSTPTVSNLVKALTPLLERLEARGFTDARMDSSTWPAVAALIHHDGICSVMPKGAFKPGVFMLGYGYGYSRTTDLEIDVVGFLQDWMNSSQANNARKSLEREAGLRCVALVASTDGPASAMVRTLSENPGTVPRTSLTLPSEIDAVIVVADQEVLDFGLHNEWRRARI